MVTTRRLEQMPVIASPPPDSLLYILTDPAGVPVDHSIRFEDLVESVSDGLTLPRDRMDALPNKAVQNASEAKFVYPTPINFGTVEDFPTPRSRGSIGIDLIGHFFDDMGLTTRIVGPPTDGPANNNGPNGYFGWYDARDFQRDSVHGYDPQRHPTLGWFKGDDPKVLNALAYWWIECGLSALSIVGGGAGFSSASWSTPTDPWYFVWQLLNNTPNMRGLPFILWGRTDGTFGVPSQNAIKAQWDDVLATIDAVKTTASPYTYTENGLTYLVMFMWDVESGLRLVFDNEAGQTNSVAALKVLATKCQAAGYDGVFVMARRGGVITASLDPTLRPAGVIVADAEYSGRYGTGNDHVDYGDNYDTYAETVVLPAAKTTIPNVCTSALSHYPHPSTFSLAGTTPAAFGRLLTRAVASVKKHGQYPMVTIYGTGEYGEAGPGLIPNMQDGWGYLDQLKMLAPLGESVFNVEELTDVLETVFAPIGSVSNQTYLPATDMDILAGATAVTIGNWRARQFRHGASDICSVSFNVPWSSINVFFVWASGGAGAGDVVWEVALDKAAAGDVLTAGSVATVAAAGTCPSLADKVVITEVMTAQAVTPGVAYNFDLIRAGFSGSDTSTDAANLVGVLVAKA